MKSQDILILLKILCYGKRYWTIETLSKDLFLSVSTVHASLKRNVIAGLIDTQKKKVLKSAFTEFLIYGLKYVFPAEMGSIVKGTLTAFSAPPLAGKIITKEKIVWRNYKGTHKGQELKPIHPNVVKASAQDEELYKLLTLMDTIRIGSAREKELAITELTKSIKNAKFE
jgi:hypothetical protein